MSPRPRLCRKIAVHPNVVYYKPQGVPLKNLEIEILTLEEWESVRLKGALELSQSEAALRMNTSQSTFQRIYASALKKIAVALTQGKAIQIHT
ncbi:DUF134 domain-containing protein [Patescibacteria group bacterium]|nr:DUF134 domain-containing protein [Patescibacteria group bacterium]